MSKAELVAAIAEQKKMSKSDVETVLEGFLSVVTDALKNQEEVRLVGFGTFKTRERKERIARNLQNGEPMTVPAARVVVFKAGKLLKDSVDY
jgi:DNA-binding protein HU-beta